MFSAFEARFAQGIDVKAVGAGLEQREDPSLHLVKLVLFQLALDNAELDWNAVVFQRIQDLAATPVRAHIIGHNIVHT